ncbi:MAG: 50S ribosomal protein L32 [Candidatus Pacebacteria bacterium]|jgi:large subunit ribosomal protein L32|nr:50S ribosomal protein L32 [Candidatus Paceibacterota bacterium]MDD3072612.1 50S ribosomal protein L32 [Candidatus Paceibacterota bacterium]MDD3728937.1 50S ribosomal protein L32 [Candidatus Paceibacterota bacterium]MDD4201554.1 50S ribosomal protein L32 [Candidatus Paceibacterota bacterium]MDD4897386.1 50S ribosomal protein L32 [Candidatus Paceibacterota bacterium]
MAVPKQRKTSSRRDNRRMHIFLETPSLVSCSHCKKKIRPHTVCYNCGYYKKEEIVNVMEKLDKKERKKREKEISLREKEEKGQDSLTMENLSK